MEIYQGSLDAPKILEKWYLEHKKDNFGAYVPFVGIVRSENNISGLSFDIYEPILKEWFKRWEDIAKQKNAIVKFAHSKGDVYLFETSYISAVFSPKRRVALELIDEFVEDFKANAPIWKYDLINNKRVYAEDRSHKLNGSGILAEWFFVNFRRKI